MEPLENLKKVRLEKLEKIKYLGVNPYPSKFDRLSITVARKKAINEVVKVAGRIMSFRGHGKLVFADLVDESGKIQLLFKFDVLGEEKIKFLELLDAGDFIGAEGKLFNTQAGELTVEVANYTLLTKSLRPLPSSWYGFKDVEERYRKRYLDLIMNPDVKKVFETRSKIIEAHRKFLINRGYLEVETPILQPLYGGGLARPFKTYHNALGIPLYLRISTELYLKRLIVGGFEKVFEVNRIFRNEGMDKNHNPEFTMLETMEAYISYEENMKLIEEMTEYVVKEVTGKTAVTFQGKEIDFKAPWKRITMVDAVKDATGIDFLKITDLEKAQKITYDLGVELDGYKESAVGLILAAVFEEKAEKNLIQPTFVYKFPVETSPLAKKCSDDPRFVERMEHYIAGMECSNNYSELNDPLDLAQRFKDERKKERLGDEEAHQTDEDFIEAMEYGMPPTSGIGPAIDRLVMIITNQPTIRDVILFPTMKPEGLAPVISQKVEIKKELPENYTAKDVFIIDPNVKQKFPGMQVGIALIKNLKIRKQDKELEKLKKEAISLRDSLTEEGVGDLPTITTYRKMFKEFGVDWHSRHPSPDALLLRIAQKKGLYNINTLVDAYNVASLKTAMGMGAFDFDKISLPVVLRFSQEGESILLLGGEETKIAKEGELVYADQKELVTLDLNYRDCDKTKITEKTLNALTFVDGGEGISKEQIREALDLQVELITKFCGGEVYFKTVIEESTLQQTQPSSSGLPDEINKKVDLGIDHQKAMELLEQYLKDPVNRKHSLESEAIMRALAKRLGEDGENWGIIGLLHDIDWEMTKDDTKKHCLKTAEILKDAGGTPYLIETIQSHGYGQGWGDNYYGPPEFADKQRSGNVQHALAAAETLTGLIVATALIHPDKKLKSVKLDSLQKKFKDKKFAANCSRNIILECEKIGLTIDEFLEIGLKALQGISSELGL